MNQPVFLVKAPDYSQAAQAVERLFSRWEGADALKGKRVTIKPNLLMKRRPDEATTTHPEVVRGVILALRKRGVTDITLADSPGGLYTPAQLSGIYAATGMAQVAQETGVTLNLDCGWQEVPAPLGERCRSFNLIDPVAQADCVISVAKLKTHCMTGLSGGVKNLFGCIPGLQKPELHYRYQEREPFCAMLLDLARTVAPVFTVVDAVESMEGDGPSAGQKRETGMLCGCESPFVLDRFLCDLLAFSPEELPTVSQSIQRGLCPADSGELLVENPDGLPLCIPDFAHPHSKPTDFTGNVPAFLARPVRWLGERYLTPRPVVDRSRCIGCGKCAESCPPKTIRIQNRKAKIDPSGCIKCFCCHEMCPVKAISVRKPRITRL